MNRAPLLFFLLFGCIQTDLENPFPPTFRIDNDLSEIVFRVDGTYELQAVYTDDTGEPADVSVSWSSSNPAILSLEGNQASPHDEGLVLVTASANGLSDTRAIEVLPSRESILISGFTPSIQVGNTSDFDFIYLDPNGKTIPDIQPTWSSADVEIATINQNGEVLAVSSGQTQIEVSYGKVVDRMTLEVLDEEVSQDPEIRITSFARFLETGESFLYKAQVYTQNGQVDDQAAISWASTNENVITINGDGLAQSIGPGSAAITASSGALTTSSPVTVDGTEVMRRSGTLTGTGYDVSGDFSLAVDAEGDLILTIENYRPDGPGPYFYLTNQSANVAGGLNLGRANVAGNIVINVSDIDASVGLNTYNFLVVWCQPFSVRLGFGQFEN